MMKMSPLIILNRLTIFFIASFPMGLLAVGVVFALVYANNTLIYYKLGWDVLNKDNLLFLAYACVRMIGGLGLGTFYLYPKYFTQANLDAVVFWGPSRSIINPISKRLFVAGIIIAVAIGVGCSAIYELAMVFAIYQLRFGS